MYYNLSDKTVFFPGCQYDCSTSTVIKQYLQHIHCHTRVRCVCVLNIRHIYCGQPQLMLLSGISTSTSPCEKTERWLSWICSLFLPSGEKLIRQWLVMQLFCWLTTWQMGTELSSHWHSGSVRETVTARGGLKFMQVHERHNFWYYCVCVNSLCVPQWCCGQQFPGTVVWTKVRPGAQLTDDSGHKLASHTETHGRMSEHFEDTDAKTQCHTHTHLPQWYWGQQLLVVLRSTARISPCEHVGIGSIHDSHTGRMENTNTISVLLLLTEESKMETTSYQRLQVQTVLVNCNLDLPHRKE